MVTNVTSFGRSGLYDWVIQRFTAVVLGVYFVGLLGYLFLTPDLDYAQWKELFSSTWMRIASLLALLSLCAHAWVGLWTISTDYLTTDMVGSNATVLRFLFQAACFVTMFIYLVWGIQILWGM
ncbi:MAG: succinate dehydrogenase, hydrophobic membrane anchor protein [Pseudohongiellaceae bacterium]|nr:succinate dehydrogenase, hydrophobic membrane anchor protein [Pseudohongiellaceae bacterium]